ncbi:MAG: DUF4907 domain-containing protein [Agriterribacter sp.]
MKLNSKKFYFFAGVLLLAVTVSIYGCSDNNKVKKGNELLKVVLTPFKVNNGWGYEIDVDGKPFIKQEVIPAISGNKNFASKEDAEKTGNVVMQKLLKGKMPSLSPEEVMALGINTTP